MADYLIMKAVEFDKLSAKFKKAHKLETLWQEGWILQKKYDGCFGMAIVRRNGGSQMLSRTGEDYTMSCQHILEELYEAAASRLEEWEDFVVLGEVWHQTLPFPTISGRFRQKREVADELMFVANDLLPVGLNTDRPYDHRLVDLWQLLPHPLPGEVFVTFTCEFYAWGEWEGDPHGFANAWKAEGNFDGAILRDPRAGYKVGTVKEGEIIKVKPVLSLDLLVENVITDVGAKTGRPVYTLDVVYRGVLTTVGSGVPHKRDAVPNPGQIIEVECMGLTEDGKLREPRFKGIRFDKEQPDT